MKSAEHRAEMAKRKAERHERTERHLYEARNPDVMIRRVIREQVAGARKSLGLLGPVK